MVYITIADIEDEVLVDLIQNSDMQYASARLDSIALSLGVLQESIATPVVDMVKELVVSIACERRAKLSVGTATRNANGDDIYELKRSTYAKDVQRLSYSLTATQITGTAASNSDMSCTIELFRA